MTDTNIFEQARNSITESLIRRYFDCPTSDVKKNQLWTLCPFRPDKKIGSFNIDLDTGLWKDFSGNANPAEGDFIKLVELAFKLKPIDAAKKIVHDSGGIIEEPQKKQEKKKEKPSAIIPIDTKNLKSLDQKVKEKWWTDKFGNAVQAYKYYKDKKLCFIVVRFEIPRSDGEKPDKNLFPFYWSEKGWTSGIPKIGKLPLFGIENFDPSLPTLIVEGEKCSKSVLGWNVLTWQGGGKNVQNADWSIIKDSENILIWPDNDAAGLQTAIKIKDEYIKSASILKIENKPNKWDKADAEKEKIDILEFIKNCDIFKPIKKEPEIDLENNTDYFHFRFMGHDDGRHFFLVSGSKIIKSIGFGKFTSSKLLELAPLSFWIFEFPAKRGFDLNAAADWVIRESEKVRFFNKQKIRGTGVWIDEGEIIINNGDEIINQKGEIIENLKTKYFYVHSEMKMGDFTGKVATNEEGEKLMDLFIKQGFETQLEALAVLGWSLIAPFAGILKWRPHIWITGPTNSGKSFLIEEIIKNLVGPFHHPGSGNDTTPGIYRSLKNDPAPILLDEMEVNKSENKDGARKIQEKIYLARNASSDSSGKITMGNSSGGTDSFFIRSPFCFASIVPSMDGNAIENRIVVCRLKNINTVPGKIETTKKYISEGLLSDSGRFRRKILQNIQFTVKYIDILREIIRDATGQIRLADNMAPLFAATFSLVNDGKIPDNKKVRKFIIDIFEKSSRADIDSDEDKLLREIFDYHIRIDPSEVKTISQLINTCAETLHEINIDEKSSDALQRHGLRFMIDKEGNKFLYIAANHSQTKEILSKTMYSTKYSEVLKRHPAAIEGHKTVRFSGQNKSAIMLDWKILDKMYFEERIEEDETMDIPF